MIEMGERIGEKISYYNVLTQLEANKIIASLRETGKMINGTFYDGTTLEVYVHDDTVDDFFKQLRRNYYGY